MEMDPLFEKLVKLRTTLVISKLHQHDPRYYELIPFLEQNLEATEKIRDRDAATGNFQEGHFKLLDMIQFISISMLDFLTVFQSYYDNKEKWGKNFFCRQLALFIHEFTIDIHNIINETLRKNDEIDKLDPALKPQIDKVAKKLSYIKQLKYDDHLKEIRDYTAAHREGNVQLLFKKIQSVDEKLIVACASFVELWIYEFFEIFKDLPQKLEALRAT